MGQFIKAIEVWVPGVQPYQLQLASSHYGDLAQFKSASESMCFAYGDGLPGKTWSEGRPIVLTDIQQRYFQRRQLAEEAKLQCAVSIPIFSGEFLQAVVVLFCGDESGQMGALELWHNHDGSKTELRLVDGYYGKLERFEWVSRKLTIMRGRGLPGAAWAENSPMLMSDLHKSSAFLRASNAADAGITSGLAIPFVYAEDDVRVLAFLTAEGSPIAKGFEIWAPSADGTLLKFHSGLKGDDADLAAHYDDTAFEKGEGALGQCWLSGRPLVVESPLKVGTVELVLPIIYAGNLNWIVRLML